MGNYNYSQNFGALTVGHLFPYLMTNPHRVPGVGGEDKWVVEPLVQYSTRLIFV